MSFEGTEVFLKGTKTANSDIYSFAMVIYNLLLTLCNHPWVDTIQSVGHCNQVVESWIADAVKAGVSPTIPNGFNCPLISI